MEQESLFSDDTVKTSPTEQQQVKARTRKKAPAKEKSAPRRRAKAKQQVDDYYAVLGVAPNATAEMIKQKYLENVRKYPPEKYPEEFKALRSAYDTLRDPESRRQYEVLFKYGETVEDLLREAAQQKRHKTGTAKAKNLLQRALAIAPQHRQARLNLARLYLHIGSMVEFELEFAELKKLASPDEWPDLWEKKIQMLCEEDMAYIAYNDLQIEISRNPYSLGQRWEMFFEVYESMDITDELLDEITNCIRAITQPVADDLYYYIAWINVTISRYMERETSKAQAAAQKFLRNFRHQPSSQQMIAMLTAECQKWRDDEAFDEARIFADLAHSLDKNNRTLQALCRDIQTICELIKAFDKAEDDYELFPLVLIEAIKLCAEEFQIELRDWHYHIEMIPPEILERMQARDEAYGAGILHLKKKYPVIYRRYQSHWDALFKEKTAGMNREERRSLRV